MTAKASTSALLIACIAIVITFFWTANSNSTFAQISGEPELPTVFLQTACPTITGEVLTVPSGGNFQAALNSAQSGDTIVLQSGAVYSGNFVLPAKSGNDWIIVRTSNLTGISVEGTRVSASQTIAMPRIVSPNAAPALATAAGAHHYRLVGLEIGIASGVATNYGIVAFGDGGQSSLSAVPHDLVIDRCYIHGNSTGDVSRGVALNSANTAVIDSNISSCHGLGFDTQAIAGWNGPGPFKIVNNFLEAAGENVMFGGADPRVPNLVPSDIEFRRNHCSKPRQWNPADPSYAGIRWSVKNVFELKNAQRVLVDGNIFENCWVDAQTGFIIVFTPRNQEGTAPWSVVKDVTFTNNIARHAAAGIQFLGRDNIFLSQQEQRIKIQNNLFYDIGGPLWGSNGRLFQMVDGTADVNINHNTAIHTSNILTADGTANAGFRFSNNIALHNEYGVMGSGHSIGNDSLNSYFPGCFFVKNVIVGGPSQVYPTQNFFPASINDVQFIDAAGENYRLALTSAYKNAGTDGYDIGVDQDAIIAAIGDGQPPTPNQAPQVSIFASATTGTFPLNVDFTSNATDADGTIASYSWDFGDNQTSVLPAVSHTYQTAGTFTARVTVFDNLGASASASISISVTNPPLPPGSEIVLYTSRAAVRAGNWNLVTDPTAARSSCVWNPDAGAPKLITPLATPPEYFELRFYAYAGRAYRLWMRARAQNDSPYNDSAFIQFSGSVDSAGAPVFRIGTPEATTVNLEDCSGCGLQGWGWQDNGWGVGVMGPLVYFSTTGPQTLRVQGREDGLVIDQIVLSPQLYLSTSPGALRNDNTILSESSGLSVTNITAILPLSGPTTGGTTVAVTGSGFSSGATVTMGGVAVASVQVDSSTSIRVVAPVHSAGTVDVVVTNPDGQTAALLGGYTYVAPTLTVRLLYPNGGETLTFDSLCNVTWSFTGTPTRQDVFLSLNGGSTWTSLASGLPSAANSLIWRVPRSPSATARIKVRLWTANGTYVEDISDGNFSIQKKAR